MKNNVEDDPDDGGEGKIEWRSGEGKRDVDDVNHNNYLDYGHSDIDPFNRHTSAA